MTMQEILDSLVTIEQDLKKIDLSKDKNISEIEKAADAALKGIDKVSHDKDFGEEHLSATVNMLKNANAEVEKYDPNKEKAKVQGNIAKRDEIMGKVRAKQAVAKKIKGKYEELNRKKAVIEKYKEKFNPKDLTKREQTRHEVNENRMKANENRMKDVIDFKDRINGEIAEINHNLLLIKELENLKKEYNAIEQLKAELTTEEKRSDADEGLINIYKGNIKQKEAKLNDNLRTFTDKYENVLLDPKNLISSVENAQNSAGMKIATSKSKIDGKLTNAEIKYNYTDGFEKFIKDKISAARTDKEYVAVFDETKRELEAQNINLDLENEKISENIETINRGQELLKNGTPTAYVDQEPTEEEIQSVIEADSDIRALAPVLTDKEMRKKVYESLTEDKKGKFHPILFFKSYGKKSQEEWKKSYEKDMREKAVKKIKEEKRKTAIDNGKAVGEVQSKRQKFMDSLFTRVMNADSKTVDQMDKDAEKAPGKTLTEVYDDMEK